MFNLNALRGKFALPVIVFAAGAALSITLATKARQETVRRADLHFEATAIDAARKVQDRFDSYTEVLIGLRALFTADEPVTRSRFRQYVSGLDLAANFPGFQVLNYAPRIESSQKTEFESRLRHDPALDPALATRLAVEPAGERGGYDPLEFIEPFAGNESALGRDLSAVPTAKLALDQARDTGGLTSSGRKIRIKGRESDIGLALRLPVYRANMPHDSVEERRAAYIGSVGAGFRVAEMFKDMSSPDAPGRPRFRLHDAGPSESRIGTRTDPVSVSSTALPSATLLFDSAPATTAPAGANLDRQVAFDLGGHRWVVQMTQKPDALLGFLDRSIGWVIAVSGIAISALLAGIVFSLNTSRARAEGMAGSITRHLRESERRLGEAQHLARLGSWELDTATSELLCSDEACRIFGIETGATIAVESLFARIPDDERREVSRLVAHARESGQRVEFDHQLRLPDGSERSVHVIVQVAEESGRVALRGTVLDDTQRRKAALRLQLEHDVAQLLVGDGVSEEVLSLALAAVCLHAGYHCATFWTVRSDGAAHCGAAWHGSGDPLVEQFTQISRTLVYSPDEGSLGRGWARDEVLTVDTSLCEHQFTRDALAGQAGLMSGLIVPTVVGGRPSAMELFSRKKLDVDAETVDALRAISLQMSQYEQRKHAERSLRHVASHDALTGLPNRASLQRAMNLAIKRSKRHQKRFAVIFVDLDHFKRINDTLGHGFGDALICACAQRLATILREDDTVARFGGDEFVLVVENLSNSADAVLVADKILDCFAQPFVIDGHELHVGASLGLSVYPEDGSNGEALLKNADAAMYRAKDKGRGTYEFYAPQMNAQGSERLLLESGLRHAMERGELELHYQPKMDLRTKAVVGVEALMRWRHPVLGLVSPAQFIPIAEETGLIVPMGLWALRTACADAIDWQGRGLPPVQMSVNLSVRQFSSRTLVDDIAAALRDSGLSPKLLELEITESVMMTNPDSAAALLQRIRDLGVGLAIDDFGTGYSSLSYLRRFPLTTVKIDRSFIKDLDLNPDAPALTAGIVTLAHGLRMKVVAEGVETIEQLNCLREHGCDEIQGFWLCKPVPSDDVCAFMARHLRNQFAAPVAA